MAGFPFAAAISFKKEADHLVVKPHVQQSRLVEGGLGIDRRIASDLTP
jgi:hypothetical protein